jgi:hypothetical protein
MATRIKSGTASPAVEAKDVSAFLSSGPINLSIMREYYRQQLIDAISERPGSKALVLDKALEGQLVHSTATMHRSNMTASHHQLVPPPPLPPSPSPPLLC